MAKLPYSGIFHTTVSIELLYFCIFPTTVSIDFSFVIKFIFFKLAVCNGIGQVISYIWTAGTGYQERVPQASELFARFCRWGNMKCEINVGFDTKYVNQPVFALDLCCSDTQWIRDGGFKCPNVVGDVYHITKRILSAASVENRPSLGLFAAELRMCFGSTSVGVFWPPEKIISAIELVQIKFERPDVGVWTANTTKAFNTEKKHIRNCLALPKVFGKLLN